MRQGVFGSGCRRKGNEESSTALVAASCSSSFGILFSANEGRTLGRWRCLQPGNVPNALSFWQRRRALGQRRLSSRARKSEGPPARIEIGNTIIVRRDV